MRLALLLAQARAPADDLLELRHGADHFIQHDQLGHLAVRARGKQLGGRGDHRVLRPNGDEVFELLLALDVPASNPHDVIRVLLHHVRIQLRQRVAHPQRCVLRRAEHDGLRHAVRALEVGRDLPGHLPDAILDDDVAIVVAVVVDSVLDFVAVDVALPLVRPPAVADIRRDIDDLEGREESVLDALLEAVGVHRVAEVRDVGDVPRLLGRRGHANLCRGREIFQNSAPAALLLGGAAMALIDDHEVEEVRLKQRGVMLLLVVPDELLIQGEVHLIRRDAAGIVLGHIDLVDGLFQRCKVLLDGLIDQYVSVSQIQDFLFHAAAQQAVDDLERGVGLARARRHDEQNPVLPAGDGVQRAVHGDALIVAGRIGALARIVRLPDDGLLCLRQARAAVCSLLKARVQLVRRREILHGDVALGTHQEVVLPESVAVRAVREGNVEHLRIRHGLLQSVRHGVLIVLGFDNRNRVVRVDVQHIVRPLRLRTRHQIAPQIDLSVGNLRLHRHPPVPLWGKRRRDEVELDVLFGHLPLGNDAAHPRPLHKMLPGSNRLPAPEDCIIRPYWMFILFYHNDGAATSMDWIRSVFQCCQRLQCPTGSAIFSRSTARLTLPYRTQTKYAKQLLYRFLHWRRIRISKLETV